MADYNLPADSGLNFTQGIDQLFVYVAQEIPEFTYLLLFSFFFVIMLGGLFAQRRSEGKGDIAMWFSIASFMTFILALIMSLAVGLINLDTVIITLSVALVGAIWFFTTRDK